MELEKEKGQDDAASADRPKSPKKRKRLGWILLTLFVLLIAVPILLIALAGGPLFPSLATWGARKAATSQGLEGDLSISGSLWNGFSVKDLEFSAIGSDSPVQSIRIDEARADYHLAGLAFHFGECGWLDTLHLKGVEVEVVLPGTTEGPTTTKPSKKVGVPIGGSRDGEFSPFWNFLRSDIRLEDLSVTINAGEKSYLLKRFALISPGAEDGTLEWDSLQIPGWKGEIPARMEIGKRENSLTIGPLPLAKGSGVQTLSFSETEPGLFEADIQAVIAGSTLRASWKSSGKANLLLSDPVSMPALLALAGQDLPLEGTVDVLALSWEGIPTTPSTWKVKGRAVASGVAWEGKGIDRAELALNEKNATLLVERPGAKIEARSTLSLETISETARLADTPITLEADARISSLESLLSDLAPDLPVSGSLEATVSSVQLGEGGSLRSGNVNIVSDNLAWDGQRVDGLQATATVERPDFVVIRADASLEEANQLGVEGALDLKEMTYDGKAALRASTDSRLREVLKHFGTPDHIAGNLELAWKGSGNIRDAEHKGEAKLSLPRMRVLEGEPFSASVEAIYSGPTAAVPNFLVSCGELQIVGSAVWKDKRIHLPKLTVTDQYAEKLRISGSVPFDPRMEGGFLSQTEDLEFSLDANSLILSTLTRLVTAKPPIDGEFSGTLSANGSFPDLLSKLNITFIPQEKAAGENSRLSLKGDWAGNLSVPKTWDLNLDALLSGLVYNGTPLQDFSLKAATQAALGSGKTLTVQLDGTQSSATIQANASLSLDRAENFEAIAKEAVSIDGSVTVERIEQVLQDFLPDREEPIPVSGALLANLEGIRWEDNALQGGNVNLTTERISIVGTEFDKLEASARITEKNRVAATLALPFDEKSSVKAEGDYQIDTGTYSGNLTATADVVSNGKFHDLVSKRNLANLLPEKTDLHWEGGGVITEQKHHGKFSFDAENLRLAGGSFPIDVKAAGEYEETAVTIPELSVHSTPLSLEGSLAWKDRILSIPELTGTDENGRKILQLTAQAPLDPEKLADGGWFRQEEDLQFDLTVDSLSFASVFRLFQEKPPVNGDATIKLALAGTPVSPTLEGNIELSNLSVPQEEGSLPVGRAEIDLSIREALGKLNGTFTHPDVNPFVLAAEFPVHLAEWSNGSRKILSEEVKATVRMEPSSLSFLQSQVPGIESINGTVALDVAVNGNIEKPKIRGNADLKVAQLKLDNRNAPSLRNIESAIRFVDDSLYIDRLSAIVAGGTMDISGSARFPADGKPDLNIHLNGSEVLVARTPDVNVRTDADLSLQGSWDTARLSGEIGITNSRFFKNIDLFPTGIGMPKKSRSALPTVEHVPSGGGPSTMDLDIGVALEPFKNWPVNVRIHTKDPFLIRGNLARSAIEADIDIFGTLGTPVPKGIVKIDEGELFLPFSSVNVEVGKLVFNEKTGFNGTLEFKARAKAGDYRVNIYVYNQVMNPKYVLTSIPPLPPEDIMTLIATGETRDDIVGDVGSVAASKAATLFFKNLRKASASADREPTVLDKLQDRTELELGKVNPETGEQTFGGKIRLWKQLFFVGDVDAQSDYRALLKYVFQFR